MARVLVLALLTIAAIGAGAQAPRPAPDDSGPADLVLLACTYVAIGLGAAWVLSQMMSRRLKGLAHIAA